MRIGDNVFLSIIIGAAIILLRWYCVYTRRKDQTERDYLDLKNKIDKMEDDPFVSEQKWREIFPIAQYAEDRYKRYHTMHPPFSIVGKIKRIIQSDGTMLPP